MVSQYLEYSQICFCINFPESNCWFSFAPAFQLFRAVKSLSLLHLCNWLIFCFLGDVALMS